MFGDVQRLLLGEPSANTPYPLARTFAPPPNNCARGGACFGLGLASFAADTRQSSGEKAGGDIDFAVFHILPVPSSLSAK